MEEGAEKLEEEARKHEVTPRSPAGHWIRRGAK